MTDSMNHTRRRVAEIAADIESGFTGQTNDDGEQYHAGNYIADAFDVTYTAGRDGSFRDARLAIDLGGPNIFVHVAQSLVVGHYGGETVQKGYTDAPGLYDAAQEAYDLTRN